MGGGVVIMSAQDVSHDPNVTYQYRTYDIVKRILDVTIALLALIILAPLWILIAVVICLTSPGPFFYMQHGVVGKGGRQFSVYKFRTMYHNSDDRLHRKYVELFLKGQPMSVIEKNGIQKPVYKFVIDDRITRSVNFFERPAWMKRPNSSTFYGGKCQWLDRAAPVAYEFEQYNEQHKHRVDVFPGITGLYQVTARSQVPFEEMLRIDLNYIQHRSIWLDLKIMLMTLGLCFKAKEHINICKSTCNRRSRFYRFLDGGFVIGKRLSGTHPG